MYCTSQITSNYGVKFPMTKVEMSLNGGEDLERVPKAKFAVRQKILGKDQDGLVYEGAIRRSMWGTRVHSQTMVGMDALQESEEHTMAEPSWHYFVHYMGWKANWDRWICEDDVMEITPENQDLAKRISQEHKALQKRFKGNKKRKIDGGEFLKAWKIKLATLMGESSDKKENVKKKKSWTLAAMEKDFKLRAKQSISTRKGGLFAQQMVLSFGLKKILVEEWEIVNQFDMVHQLPAEVTVQKVLDMYLESKGIEKSTLKLQSDETITNEEILEQERRTEFIEMAEGILLFFEQALPFRLLYPSEQSQLSVLENTEKYQDTPKAELYGCEFLLRLFCQLPSILAEAYENEEDITKPMLAKINDIIRFLTKNQSHLFSVTPYRVKNEDELRLEQKIAKREERKRKLALAQIEIKSSDGEASKAE